ncbi:MAG: hypothetical protein Q9227_003609 [Pyrenula ochraceoflavens]
MPSRTYPYKEDQSAGPIPAIVHFQPKDDNQGQARPIVVIFHAGGYVLGSTDIIPQYEIDTLTRLGFIVVNCEYRLCPQVSIFDGPIRDAKDCFQWMKTALPGLLEKDEGIKADPLKTAAIGQSAGANLALLLGAEPEPPTAILDMYGVKYMDEPYLWEPAPMFAGLPEIPQSFTDKIFEGPQALTAGPMFANGKPVLDDPRVAWFLMQQKHGQSKDVFVPDGNMDRIDAVKHFHKGFPPTYFIQGTADKFTLTRLAEKAHNELKALGVETELAMPEGIDHAFDLQGDKMEELIDQHAVPGFRFLAKHVGLLAE